VTGPRPNAKVFEHSTSFDVPARTPNATRGPVLPRPDRKPEPISDFIDRLAADSAQTVSFRDGPDGEPVTRPRAAAFARQEVHR
jgi:hypothetical protein